MFTFDLWSPIPILNTEPKSILEGTWAGELLKRIEDHENERADARQAQEEFEDPVNAQKRRVEKKRLNAEKHQERLERKKERDRLWRIEQTNTEIPEEAAFTISWKFTGDINAMKERAQRIEILSRDYWFKVVEFLQQNWALIDETPEGAMTFFLGDTAGVFDEMVFESIHAAERGLQRNGFKRYLDDPDSREFIAIPDEPFVRHPHPNGPIYSSGRYWN